MFLQTNHRSRRTCTWCLQSRDCMQATEMDYIYIYICLSLSLSIYIYVCVRVELSLYTLESLFCFLYFFCWIDLFAFSYGCLFSFSLCCFFNHRDIYLCGCPLGHGKQAKYSIYHLASARILIHVFAGLTLLCYLTSCKLSTFYVFLLILCMLPGLYMPGLLIMPGSREDLLKMKGESTVDQLHQINICPFEI